MRPDRMSDDMRTDEGPRRLEAFVRAHRDRGLPVTAQRRAVFEAALRHGHHPTADQIHMAVRRRLPEISRMTVYRILGNLVTLGLLARICHPGSVARFDPKIHQHHHLVCLDCGTIVDLEEERFNDVAWPDVRRLGFEIEGYSIDFRGRCASCRKAAGITQQSQRKASKPKRKERTA